MGSRSPDVERPEFVRIFHGRTQMTDTTDIETLNADKADLTTRTAYLKEKFKTIGRDGKKISIFTNIQFMTKPMKTFFAGR